MWCQGTTSGMMETVCLHTRTWQWHCLGILFLTLETYLGKPIWDFVTSITQRKKNLQNRAGDHIVGKNWLLFYFLIFGYDKKTFFLVEVIFFRIMKKKDDSYFIFSHSTCWFLSNFANKAHHIKIIAWKCWSFLMDLLIWGILNQNRT